MIGEGRRHTNCVRKLEVLSVGCTQTINSGGKILCLIDLSGPAVSPFVMSKGGRRSN